MLQLLFLDAATQSSVLLLLVAMLVSLPVVLADVALCFKIHDVGTMIDVGIALIFAVTAFAATATAASAAAAAIASVWRAFCAVVIPS